MKFRSFSFFLFCTTIACAQSDRTTLALWAFPGITWTSSPSLKFSGQYGFNPPLKIHAAYLQAFIKTGRYWTLNPAYLYLERQDGLVQKEHTFLPAALFSLPLGRHWLLEDRNQLWLRFRNKREDIHYYRNRLRVFFLRKGPAWRFRPYVFDEVFYFFNRGHWSRTRIAAGMACDVHSKVSLDVSFVHEQDRYSGRQYIVFIMGTLSLPHKSGRHFERNEQKKRMRR